ncbi:cyclic nucleotide-binding domain-containing protein [Variovorax sp. J22G21]|uniref:Crp/Fnr family transcriptional regulator n=1 Tax=Variovorax fucosicus TaxID=3053517 RepID=UPI0025774AB3|nr:MULTISPECIES: cyclic nucleotide-binding domain-containing protein [unclassified Variovorax]MDM0039300.1 cyclic nucleotide-binding domain-containing protein [Variovorax sp. J22R193]MDM0055088.1 cyclic nucleotide-binding domain-containing protein [Variovorax sp. J22G47]MDM0064076.1 cyclic nucleotide-binding domain-containing protein [Variovorax sp. J22G21]
MSSTIQDLCRAVAQNTSYDAFAPALSPQQWELLAAYMVPNDLSAGEVLINQGSHDRTLFFIESGALSVHLIGDKGQMQLAILNPGSVVGEGSFFSRLPRSANVVATGSARVWRMTPIRFAELANRQPSVGLELIMALGGVIAKRMVNRPKRVAVT